MTLADRLRSAAGGDIVELLDPRADLLRHALHWFARDMWPYLLLGRPMSGAPTNGVGAAALSHPAQARLRDALANPRESVGRLFAQTEDYLAESSRISSSKRDDRDGSARLARLRGSTQRSDPPRTNRNTGSA